MSLVKISVDLVRWILVKQIHEMLFGSYPEFSRYHAMPSSHASPTCHRHHMICVVAIFANRTNLTILSTRDLLRKSETKRNYRALISKYVSCQPQFTEPSSFGRWWNTVTVAEFHQNCPLKNIVRQNIFQRENWRAYKSQICWVHVSLWSRSTWQPTCKNNE